MNESGTWQEMNINSVIIDVNKAKNYRIKNIYQSLAPERDATPTENFINQLLLIQNAINDSPRKIDIFMGDFNLGYIKIYNNRYPFSHIRVSLISNF